MAPSEFVREVSDATFEDDVIKRSAQAPVVVDFWAEWCAPCRALGPVLERLAEEAAGEWTLAKVDVDANQSLAHTYQVYGIPAVKAFKDGQVIAEFTGALPEEQVRLWLRSLGPSDADLAAEEGAAAEARGDLDAAAEAYQRALHNDPGHPAARGGLARVGLETRTKSLDPTQLQKQLEASPNDVTAAASLSDLDFRNGDVERALDRLVDLVRRTDGDARDHARRHLLLLLDLLPPDDPRAAGARKALAGALF